ncbi:MAG: TIGR02302 family protein [Candidatus Eiseniibacteriota bacterium]
MTPNDRLPPTTPAHRLLLAQAALFWERLWRALWPASGIVGLFLVVALFDLLPFLPGVLHAIVLALFAAALGYALWRGLRRFAVPTRLEARRRIETASRLAHRPLTTLDDRVATGAMDEATLAIWRVHQKRAAESLKRLRAGVPAPGLARLDPLALRGGLAIVLMVAVILSWTDADERLARAMTPAIAPGQTTAVAVELWITPPKYTGRAPIYLQPAKEADHANAEVEVPAGSTLLAQVTGGHGTPTLRLDAKTIDFADTGDQAFQATAPLDGTRHLVVRQRGRDLGQWTLRNIPDAAPTVAFLKKPAPTQRGALRFDYEAKDDYGVESLHLVVRRDVDGTKDPKAAAEEPLVIDLSQAGSVQRTIRGTRFQDLTPHPWAGMPVVMQLEAKDALGQTALSEPVKLVLPEREFKHPVAKALVEARKELLRDPVNNREIVAETVGTLALRPDRYHDDKVAFLAMRMAQARLYMDQSDQAIASVAGLLWDTALRIEEGKLSVAERDLRNAQQALQDALNRNAPDQEIQKLIDDLQKALQRFMQELAQDMQNHPERYARQQPMDPNAMVLDQQDLQRMIDRLRDMARTGARDAAREMLSQLRNMLENLRGMAQRPGQMQRGNNPASQAMRDMQGLIQRQQELMNRTFRDQQRMESGDQSVGQDMQGRAMEQEALRRMLGEMMRRFGDMTGQIPEGLGRAERSMRDATEQLQRESPGRAVGPQGKALEEMRQGMRQAMQELGRQFGMGTGEPDPDQLGERPDPSQDPLGRPIEGFGNANTSDVKIPEEADVQRAREILDELRRRSSDPARPQIERDYIDRLLKRF